MSEKQLPATARGGVHSLIFRVLSGLSDFAVVLVTSRGFGPEGRGLYALTSLVITSAGMILGGPAVVIRSEVGRKRVALGRLFAASLVLAGALIVLALVVVPAALAVWPHGSVVLYAAVALPPMALMELQISLYQALGDMRRMHYVWLARSVVPLAALTGMALVRPGDIHTALLAWACVQFIVPALTLKVQRRQAALEFRGLRPLLVRLVRRGIPVSVANGFGRLNTRVDLIVVAALLTVADVGRYSVATAVGEGVLLLSRAAITGAYASIIGAELSESVRVAVRTIRHCIALVVPAGLVLTLLARVGMGPVFGSGFEDVWLLVGLLLPAFVALSVGELLVHFFVVRLERSRDFLVMSILTSVVNLALAATLVTLVGLPGAAISASIVQTLGLLYLMMHLLRVGAPRNPRAYLPGRAELSDYGRVLDVARRQPRRLSRKNT